ncbi:hypothetical protein [Virgibacillus proomii]|jgi:hypothetical protein|uniref:hypothetical protein n=1 Tax=Virgibacillus proomii TaxID=84407 RepID=UPI0009852EC3|nr:hypothetical protein [Virgibacillus proomii]
MLVERIGDLGPRFLQFSSPDRSLLVARPLKLDDEATFKQIIRHEQTAIFSYTTKRVAIYLQPINYTDQ